MLPQPPRLLQRRQSRHPPLRQLLHQHQEKISYIQSLTNGKVPWIDFAIGVAIGVIITYLVFKHARRMRKAVKQGEKFVFHHPLFDVTLVALIALLVVATQTIGAIY